MLSIGQTALEQLSALLLERAGLRIAPDGYHGLRLALKERMPALGIADADEYVRRLRERQGEHELRALLPLVTVTHTEFFRDPRQFRALEKRVIPEALARARRDGRQLRIWSAGCATGEEAYSLAILLDEVGASPDEADLWATDLNQAAIESARAGIYPLRRMGPISPERVRRYFRPVEDGYQVIPSLRDRVRFEGHNLAAPVFAKVEAGTYDIILCRNVIIYFDLPTIRALMDRFHAALRPGAFLVLGYSESLFRVYDRFEMVEVEGAFLYRRPRTDRAAVLGGTFGRPLQGVSLRGVMEGADRRTPESAARLRVTGEFPVIVPARTSPITPPLGIPAASGRPRPQNTGEIPDPGPVQGERESSPPVSVTRRAPAERLADAARMVQEGRFEESVRTLNAIRSEEPDDIAASLTLGNVYSVMGRAEAAQQVFSDVVNREPLCVEVRVYAAMALMQVNQYAQARAEISKALFLEPTLALAHYLSAQISERLGDRDGARRAYRNAVTQLRFAQRPLAGYYPDLPDSPELISRAARYALAALEEEPAA